MSLYVVGCGGLGREMAMSIPHAQFLDDNKKLHGKEINKIRVIGTIEDLAHTKSIAYIGIGNPQAREKISNRLTECALQPDDAHVLGKYLRAEFGIGSFVAYGATITVDVNIGNHVAVLNNAVVGHDSTIDDYSIICPGAIISGNCKIGKRVFVGAGAVILPNILIGDDSVVGAGSVVTCDMKPNTKAVGNPARRIN